MTYNEWRDELKSNLLSVSESERRRVLDYYAEAYADRRDAGFTEREIIEDFGAPYDAAQRILSENRESYGRGDFYEPADGYSSRRDDRRRDDRREERERRREERFEERERLREERLEERERLREQRREERREERRAEKRSRDYDYFDDDYEPAPARRGKTESKKSGDNYTWVFVLLCIVFAAPLFGLVMGMVGITIGLCVAPFAVVVGGAVTAVTGIVNMFSNFVGGLWTAGVGLIIFGVGVALISIFPRMVKLMWKIFNSFFRWLKSLFSGKEA